MDISGATDATLTLSNIQTAMVGNYRARISNGAGSVFTDEATFMLIVPPVITSTTPPAPSTKVNPDPTLSIVFTVHATTTPGSTLKYQWYKNGEPITNWSMPSYIENITLQSEGEMMSNNVVNEYYVKVSNEAGSVDSPVWTYRYTLDWATPGTLAYHLATNAVARAAGLTPIPNVWCEVTNWFPGNYYNTPDTIGLLTNVNWSTNCWLHGVQGLTATSLQFSNMPAGQYLVTMVSPRHFIRAYHTANYFPSNQMAFLDSNNVVYWRAVKQQVTLPNDVTVGIFDSDLPPSVGFVPVLPPDYADYLPTNGMACRIQGVTLNQYLCVFSEPIWMGEPMNNWGNTYTIPYGLDTNWSFKIEVGDSSNPEWLLIENQLVLVSEHSSSGDGPNYGCMFDSINQWMHFLSINNNLETDYQLTPISLTNFTKIH